MGFTMDPGPLPLMTVRDHKWANRLMIGELIEIHGEHGCTMPSIAAEVKRIEDFKGEVPPALAHVYAGKRLVVIALVKPAVEWVKIGEGWHRVDGSPALR